MIADFSGLRRSFLFSYIFSELVSEHDTGQTQGENSYNVGNIHATPPFHETPLFGIYVIGGSSPSVGGLTAYRFGSLVLYGITPIEIGQ